jgi:uncharacterized protein involved in tolerance to divalent cations
MQANDLLIVSVTCGSGGDALKLAMLLVERKLAACCQTYPITSTYRWQGKIETAQEVMLTAKTLAEKLPALETLVKQHHSYDVPEIIATPVAYASADYAQWLRESLSD